MTRTKTGGGVGTNQYGTIGTSKRTTRERLTAPAMVAIIPASTPPRAPRKKPDRKLAKAITAQVMQSPETDASFDQAFIDHEGQYWPGYSTHRKHRPWMDITDKVMEGLAPKVASLPKRDQSEIRGRIDYAVRQRIEQDPKWEDLSAPTAGQVRAQELLYDEGQQAFEIHDQVQDEWSGTYDRDNDRGEWPWNDMSERFLAATEDKWKDLNDADRNDVRSAVQSHFEREVRDVYNWRVTSSRDALDNEE